MGKSRQSKRNIYIDSTELFYSNENTGIQRVERNIIRSSRKICGHYDVGVQAVAFLGKMGGLRKVRNKKLGEGFELGVGYWEGVLLSALRPNRLRILSRSMFPFAAGCIDRQWKRWRFFMYLPMSVVALLLSVFSILIYMPIKRNVRFRKEDVYLIPGSSWWSHDLREPIDNARNAGAKVVLILHDLIAITNPEYCHNVIISQIREKVSYVLRKVDVVVCVSEFTRHELERLRGELKIDRLPRVEVNYSGFNLDLAEDEPLERDEVSEVLAGSFIAVGTVEPRKNYGFLLDAFDSLWKGGSTEKLCIIGKRGWKCDELINRIESHPKIRDRLFWFSDLNDDELLYAYKHSKACLYPSRVEGFGLPLIEALSLGCPVLASDIPVFREIGGDYVRYFPLDERDSLEKLIDQVADSDPGKERQRLRDFTWPNWDESTARLIKLILA